MRMCLLCGSTAVDEIFENRLKFHLTGSEKSKEKKKIVKCSKCNLMWLENTNYENEFYINEDYRSSVGEDYRLDKFYSRHDNLNLSHINTTGIHIMRNKVIADVGCACGAFLDLFNGIASEIIAIEPMNLFREECKKKGYHVYDYLENALKDYKNKVDVITSFDVIEHTENPVEFLIECKELLSKDGKVIIGTPNSNDILMKAMPEVFYEYFFRDSHLYSLNGTNLKGIMEKAGFKNVEIIYKHNYGLGNFISWLKDKKPMGDIKLEYISDELSAQWVKNIEKQGLSDYCYAIGTI